MLELELTSKASLQLETIQNLIKFLDWWFSNEILKYLIDLCFQWVWLHLQFLTFLFSRLSNIDYFVHYRLENIVQFTVKKLLFCFLSRIQFVSKHPLQTNLRHLVWFKIRYTFLPDSLAHKTRILLIFDFTDEPLTIIEVPLKDNIQISIDSFHNSELLEGTRAAECKICKEDTETLRESWFSSLPEILFIHLNRFNVDGKTIRKNLDWVDYENEINVPQMLDPEVMVPIPCPYTLRAVIYHSGPFGKGHYTAHVRYRGSTNWILCNDNAVCVLNEHKAKKKPIDPKTPYLFVYSRL